MPRSTASPSPGYLADLSLFQRVQTECMASGDRDCVSRFRALYKGKERYTDEALKRQFDALGFCNTTTPASSADPTAGDQKKTDNRNLSGSSLQLPVSEGNLTKMRSKRVIEEVVVLEDNDSDHDDDGDYCSEEKHIEEAGLAYEPQSPVVGFSLPAIVPPFKLCPASLDNTARKPEDRLDDGATGIRLHQVAVSTADPSTTGIQVDSVLIDAVIAALAIRKTHKTAAKRRRDDEEKQAARQKWKQQCRDRAGAVGRTVYRGITTLACGYGLAQAIAAVYPSELEQAASLAHQQLATFMRPV